MRELARLTLRGRVGQVVALAATLLFAATLVGAFGLLVDTGIHGTVSTGEYRKPPLLVGPRESVAVTGDEDLPVPGRGLLSASVVTDIERAAPGSRVVADRVVPASLSIARNSSEPVDAHPWSAFALADRSLSSGRPATGSREIVMPEQLATSHGLAAGDAVQLGFGDTARTYTLVGTTTGDDRGVDVADVYINDGQIETYARADHPVSAVGVWPASSTDARAVARVAAQDGARLWNRDDRGSIEVVSQGRDKAALVSAAAPSGAIAIIIATFTVMGLTSLQIRERSRELAMLRVVGATPKQVKKLLRGEIRLVAVLTGLSGAILGPFLGAVMVEMIRSWGVVPQTLEPVFGPWPFVAGFLTGVLASEVATRVSVRRVVQGSPLVQLDGPDNGQARSWRRVARTCWGVTVLAAGIALALAPVYTSNVELGSALPGVSGLVMAVAIALLSPLVVRIAAGFAPPRTTRTASGYLAVNSIRHRSARVGGALSPIVLGVALATVQFSTSATLDAVAAAQYDAGSRADVIVSAPVTGISERTVHRISGVPGVETATPFMDGNVIARVSGGDTVQDLDALGLPGDEIGRYAELQPTDGETIRLQPGQVALGVQGAAELDAHLGSELALTLPDGRSVVRRVEALYKRGLGFGEIVLPIDDLQTASPSGHASGVAVAVAGGTAVSKVATQVHDQLANRPGMQVTVTGGAGPEAGGGGTDKFQLLLLAVLFGYIGIAVANSIVVATLARRREFILLSVVGSTPRDISRLRHWEAVFLATTACVLGTAIALPGMVSMTFSLSNGDRILPAVNPHAYLAIVVITFTLVFAIAASAGKALGRSRA